MADNYQNPAESYEALLELERVFIEHVKDDEIRDAYLAARRGEKAGKRKLTEIAMPACSRKEQPTERHGKADRALQLLLYWFKQDTQ